MATQHVPDGQTRDDDAPVRVGSVCTGSLMLDVAIEHTFGGQTVWCAETDPHASRLIARRRPGLPNLGDLAGIDWHQLADTRPVDLLAGGYSCQPFSLAGHRGGTGDDRHVWPHIAHGLTVLRPPLAIFENVAGHLTLGFDQVLADLAHLGYRACWTTLPASSIGACHGRPRLFITAADTRPPGRSLAERILDRTRRRTVRAGTVHRHTARLRPDGPPHDHHPARPADTADRSAHDRPGEPGNPPVTQLLPTPSVADGTGGHHRRGGDRSGELLLPGIATTLGFADTSDIADTRLLPTPTTSDRNGPGAYRAGGPGLHTVADHLTRNGSGRNRPRGTNTDNSLFANPDLDGDGDTASSAARLLPTPTATDGYGAHQPTASITDRADAGKANLPEVAATAQFGAYQPAIDQWAHITGHRPPPITVAMKTRKAHQQRRVLNPQFSEWMMGWPPGWATDPHLWDHLPASRARTLQLGIIGNGVCPQQAAAALTWILHIWHTEPEETP